MTKNNVFNSYLIESNIPKELFPVELYFMQYRAESKNKIEDSNHKILTTQVIDIKPNYLNKIDYSGNVHNLPTNSLSLIINNENLI